MSDLKNNIYNVYNLIFAYVHEGLVRRTPKITTVVNSFYKNERALGIYRHLRNP